MIAEICRRVQKHAAASVIPHPSSAAASDARSGGAVLASRSIVVSVSRRELHPVESAQAVARCTLVAFDVQPVSLRLVGHAKRMVLGPVPLAVSRSLEVDTQPISTIFSQLVQFFVADPVVTFRSAESDFVLGPGPIEESRSVEMLLNEDSTVH